MGCWMVILVLDIKVKTFLYVEKPSQMTKYIEQPHNKKFNVCSSIRKYRCYDSDRLKVHAHFK